MNERTKWMLSSLRDLIGKIDRDGVQQTFADSFPYRAPAEYPSTEEGQLAELLRDLASFGN